MERRKLKKTVIAQTPAAYTMEHTTSSDKNENSNTDIIVLLTHFSFQTTFNSKN